MKKSSSALSLSIAKTFNSKDKVPMESNNNQGVSMKKSFPFVSDLKDNAPQCSSIAKHLHKADLYAEGFSAEEGESHKLMGITTQTLDDAERFEETMRKARGFNNRRAMVEAYFHYNPELLPKYTDANDNDIAWDFKDESHVEMLALFVESMREDEATSTGNNYKPNEGVTVILQGYSFKSGRWFTLTQSYEDQTKLIFNTDVDAICTLQNGVVSGLKFSNVKHSSFDLKSKKIHTVTTSTPQLALDCMKDGVILDGTNFRAVLISNAFGAWVGEVDSYKMVKETQKVIVVMEDDTKRELEISKDDAKWVRQDSLWDMGIEMAPGILVLPATTDTRHAVRELKEMEADIQIGVEGLSSNAAVTLADMDEHMAIVREQDYIARLEAKALVRLMTKSLKTQNVLDDNADAAAIMEAVYTVVETDGPESAISILTQYEEMGLELWTVFFAVKARTGKNLPGPVFATLKRIMTVCKNAKMETELMAKCNDEIKGLILLINAGEKIALTPTQALEVFEAAVAGERIQDKVTYASIRILALAEKARLANIA